MRSPRKALIVCMRYPEPGCVKSRLAASVGATEACAVYEKLLRKTLGVASGIKRFHPETAAFLFYTPPDKLDRIRARFAGPWTFLPQSGRHIGEVMEDAFRQVARLGYGDTVLVGSDLPGIECSWIEEAFARLEEGSAVLGPAADGGFYLIGLRRPCGAPFRSENWGDPSVCARTVQALHMAGLEVRLLREQRDADRPEDLAFLRQTPCFRESLSVIVPTLSPPEKLLSFTESLQDQIWPGDEIILVQGSGPETGPVRTIAPAVLHTVSPRGRGLQLNRGAALAGGSILLFLHDDCKAPPGFAYFVRRACEDASMSLGCFELSFSPSNRRLDFIAGWANLRTRFLNTPYGDQGFFCRAETFVRTGGFRKRFLMEDVDFAERSKKLGRLCMLPYHIETAPDRYLEKGILKASLLNHLTLFLYFLGVSDRRLYSFYYGTPHDA